MSMKKKKEKKVLAWHFVSNDKKLGYDDGRIVKAGKTYSCKGKPVLCENGMHASKRLIDALLELLLIQQGLWDVENGFTRPFKFKERRKK